MILPIVPYGASILRRKCVPVLAGFPDDAGFQQLLSDMWETLANAEGAGLAAPQVNVDARLFIVNDASLRQVFINPVMLSRSAETIRDEEGCLSIPGLVQPVDRSREISLTYYDETGAFHSKIFYDLIARAIQHEYDHIEGKLYIDLLPPLRRRLLRNPLECIRKGDYRSSYPMLHSK